MSRSAETYKRVVVEGAWDGDVLPGRIEELQRQIVVTPGSKVSGSILGHTVRVEGSAFVQGAIYATKDLELIPYSQIHVASAVAAREMVVAMPDEERVIIEGDVTARTIRLTNALVLGSILGDEVWLENVRCLGFVIGRDLVEAGETTMLAASGGSVTLKSGCGLILPFVKAETSLTIDQPVKFVGAQTENNLLAAEDVSVGKEGGYYLTAGRRLTNLETIRAQVENVSNFILRLSVGDSIRALPEEVAFDVEALPEELSPFAALQEGEGSLIDPDA